MIFARADSETVSLSISLRRLLAAALCIALVGAAVLVFQPADTTSPELAVDAVDLGDAQIERGRYLALAGNCASCHSHTDGDYMAGGVAFDTPFGRIYSTNITPDVETGIGSWSVQDFARSMRRGVRPDGAHLYPAFPYTAFTRMSDDDLVALFAFFRSIPAIRRDNADNDLRFPFNVRALLSVWKGMYLDAGAFATDDAQSDVWNRGAYLVEALAHCSACHSPRNLLGAEEIEQAMSGGRYRDAVPGGEKRTWFAPNLTSAHSGLGIWPEAELVDYLKTGRNTFVETFGPMNDVIMNSTRHLREQDVAAMAVYLKSLPAREQETGPEPDTRTLGMGRTVYNLHCGTCHLPSGLGDPEMAPQLANGSLVVRASDPASLINVILYGPEPPDPPLPPKWREPMDEFQYLLDDDEIAALASFLRHSWDNTGGAVTPDQVELQR